MALILRYPKRQSIALSTTLFRLYEEALLSDEEEIVFDLSNSESLSPFGVIMLTSTILNCQRKGKKCKYNEPKKKKQRDSLNEIGFYNFFHLQPKIDKKDLIQTKNVQLRWCDGLDYDIIERLTKLFNSYLNLSPGVFGSLRMSLQEMMSNVLDHSGVKIYLLCAITNESKKQIRVCMADMGRGILGSLQKSQKYKHLSDSYQAIRASVEEGVTSRPKQQDGLGLTHIKNFIKINEGQLCIISGKGKVFWKYDHRKILNQRMITPFKGTIVKLIINIDKEGFYFLSDEKEYLF